MSTIETWTGGAPGVNFYTGYPARRIASPAYAAAQAFPSPSAAGANTESLSGPRRLYQYLGPGQFVPLFVAGVAASFALRWFARGLHMPRLDTSGLMKETPLKQLSKKALDVQDQTFTMFTSELVSVLMFALHNPAQIQERLRAYIGASVLGYLGGSLAQGLQEVFVRREETQIRADLLNQLTRNFRNSIQLKTRMDNQLRESAKQRIMEMLKQCRIPYPGQLLKPLPESLQDPLYRYPYEPYHFSKPVSTAYRFGQTLLSPQEDSTLTNPPGRMNLIKGAVFAAGLLTGGLAQFMATMMRAYSKSPGIYHLGENAKRIFYRNFSIQNIEALFLTESGPILWTILGLTALAKVGKMLVDGYREIEVTRQHAVTELRYQSYNWLALDPAFHRIAEEEALEDALRKLREAITYEYNNRQALNQRIQTILTNIGRNSAPKYFQMTPPVNLVAARS